MAAVIEQWEYLTKTGCSPKDLAKLGEQGWELVSTSVSGLMGSWVTFYFKRRKG